jgi:signal transduction histidine kinase
MRLRNWPIRTRIFSLFLIPLLSLIGIYVFATLTTVGDSNTLARATEVRNSIADPIGFFATDVQQERLFATIYLASPSQRELGSLEAQEPKTDAALSALRAALDSSGTQGASAPSVRADMKASLADAAGLPALRAKIAAGKISMSAAQAAYTGMIAAGYQTIGQATLEMPSSTLVDQASSVLRIADAEDLLLQAQALLIGDESAGSFPPADHARFAELTGGYQGLLNQAIPDLEPAYQAPFHAAVTTPAAASLSTLESQFLNAPASPAGASGGHTAQPGPTGSSAQSAAAKQLNEYSSAVTTVATGLAEAGFQAGNTLADALHAEAGPINFRLFVAGGLGLLAIIVSVAASIWIGTGLIRQLAGLRDEALDLAEDRLPDVMARLSAGEDIDIEREAPLLPTSRDEIGQVSKAFNEVQRAAVAAAARQARLRNGISIVFRNLARRSQSLLHEQLSLLDALELRATDAAELERLFRIDHLATRMRRHAEGLVVLAGDQPSRGWTDPVPLVDVLRGAVAEVVDYTRIRVACASTAALTGRAVADVIHLLAELADNATAYSRADTPVRVYGIQAVNGFAIEIEDRGTGMPGEKIARINAVLADPPPFNLARSQQLGLFVAARLARRHGIGISLRSSPFGGITAVVLIPLDLIVTERTPNEAQGPGTALTNGYPHTPANGYADTPVNGYPGNSANGYDRGLADGHHPERPPGRTAPWDTGGQPSGDPQPLPSQGAPAPVPPPAAPPWDTPGWDVGNLPTRDRLASLPAYLRTAPSPRAQATRGRAAAAAADTDATSWPGEIRNVLNAMREGTERGRHEHAPHSARADRQERPDLGWNTPGTADTGA